MPASRHPASTFKALALSAAALTAGLCAAGPASAGLQFYSDPSLFMAAAGTLQAESFNSYAADLAASGGSRLLMTDFAVQGAWIVDAPAARRHIDGSTNLFIDVSYGGWADLHFDQPLTAFGAWFSGVPASLRVDADSLQGYGSYRHLGALQPGASESGLQFIGFIADESFNRIVFEGRGCCSGSFAVDTLSYAFANAQGPVSTVPEPASWALLLAGLGAAGLWGRRQRHAATASRAWYYTDDVTPRLTA